MARSAGRMQRKEGPRVAYGVGVAIVVEVDEHVLAGQIPFPDPVRPPRQVSVGVTVPSVRSRSPASDSASPGGTIASSRELACTSRSRCCS
jgi:hypothetical protein